MSQGTVSKSSLVTSPANSFLVARSETTWSEQYEGIRFRIYSKSHFIDYMALESFASDDYPGPTQHYLT